MEPQTAIEIEIFAPTACIVTLRGEHDLSSRPGMTLALAVASGYRNVLVDLTGCTFGDSSLITALLLSSQRLRQRDGLLELVVPPGAHLVRRVLELAKVHRMLPFHETRAAGLASLAAAERDQRPPEAGTRSSERKAAGRSGVTVVRARVAEEPVVLAEPADTTVSET